MIEIGASGTTARLTIGAQVESLRFLGYTSATPSSYFWREQDHAAICVFLSAGVVRYSYLEAYYLRTATLTLNANIATELPAAGVPTPPATLPFAGRWSGQLTPGPAFEIEIPTSGATATFKDAGLGLEALTFVGYEPTTPTLYYWRAQEHAIVSLYAQGGGVGFSYLEGEFLRTGMLSQPGAANLLANGSFELGTPGNFLVLNAGSNAIAPWEITAGGIDVTNGSPPIGPQNGTRNIDLDGFYQAGTIGQNFTAQAGKSYLLSFYMSANPGGAVVKQIEVTVGNKTRVFSYDWSGGGAWVRCELPFQALSNAERIVVRSLSLSDSTFGACLDNFVIEELSCEAECAALQQALNDALAALTQATASVASLTQQLATANADKAALQQQLAQANADKAALQAQLATANASIASLQQQLTVAQSQIAQLTADKAALETQRAAAQAQVVSLQAANAALTQQLAAANALIASLQGSLEATAASLGRVQADFRTVFNDSTFTIPGATTAVQADNLATAVIGLNHGRKKGIYDALK